MSLDDYLTIDTPENVAFGYEVAGLGSRFMAAIVDTLLILIIQVIVNLVLAFVVVGVLSRFVEDEEALILWSAAGLGLGAFAFFLGYYIFFEMIWKGPFPGKRWVGVRGIRTNGTPISLTGAILRNLVRAI